ncbi:hypothetical protein P152DRAFT_168381 [Eremomyces bilateralis CBS 781.70]|uniref:1,3-beta-glucanosyltransferase n=1 Tax=Eremomyces bilateralis CBS 781.70 TaxID=1392243 RepID=A0A6G1FUH4_9PEZI|nr:uncharacterized protein P152DRAFT_168381 [Eremomyces bilateralis CBS 781.70]KAF1809301.1 hypothetical protein P152DRAFT_168381 [Eremomyces bilateralis CBS 781.70]
MRSSLLAATLAALTASSAAIPTIEVKGSKFFTSEGDQWFIKGIAYQLVPEDPLIDTDQCERDASLMSELGANAIRVYHVNPSGDHTGCMSAFAEKGIYAFIDLDDFDTQIEQNHPWWNETQHSMFSDVMDAFHTFENVAGFFVGNEVITMKNGSLAAPYVKAAARDMKAYRDSKDYRQIPIGYSAADIATLRPMLQNYLACGTNYSESLDFFALNAYEWCGKTTFEESGYAALTKNVTEYSIPIYFSETGCNTVRPRTFADQAAIFGPKMAPYWSGSIVYEWIQEANNYGLISYGEKVDPSLPDAPPDGFTRSGTPTPVQPDFDNLKSQWQTLTPSGVQKSAYTPSLAAPPCPTRISDFWDVDGDVSLPSIGQQLDLEGSATATVTATGTGSALVPTSGAGAVGEGAAGEEGAAGRMAPSREWVWGVVVALAAVGMGMVLL